MTSVCFKITKQPVKKVGKRRLAQIPMCRLLFKVVKHFEKVCFFKANIPVNKFSVMSGRSHRFLGITSTYFEKEMPISHS